VASDIGPAHRPLASELKASLLMRKRNLSFAGLEIRDKVGHFLNKFTVFDIVKIAKFPPFWGAFGGCL